jgi:ABC-type Mn2+/Zn2+ transport system permease subunit
MSSRQLSPERRKIVIIAASVAALSGVTPVLLKDHPYLRIGMLVCITCALVYVVVAMAKLKRGER